MRLTFIMGALTLVLGVQAQELSKCAKTCLATSFEQNPTCSPTDAGCICADTALMAAIEGCVLQTCTVKESLVAKNYSMTLCNAPIRDITNITPIVTGISGLLAIIAVSVRTFSTASLNHADTICAILALIFALPMGILELVMSHDGFGKDIWTLAPEKITRIVQYTWLTEIFYFIAGGFTKMSFLFLYLRIFPAQEIRRVIHIMIVFSILYAITFSFTCLFNCLPVSYIWNKWHGEASGRCFNFNTFAWAHAAVNIASDLVIIALPIPELLKLSMNRKKKVYVVVMFSMGFFITIVSIIRLRSLIVFSTTANPTWDAVPTAYWSVLECFVGIICVCLPALRVILGRVFPTCFGSTQQEYSDTPIRSSRRTPVFSDFSITKTVDATVTSVPRDEQEYRGFGNLNGNGYGGAYGGVYGEDGLQLVEFDGVKKAYEGKGVKADAPGGTVDTQSGRSSQGNRDGEEVKQGTD